MIKQVLTYCILLNFILILSPRTIWHNHNAIAQTSENQNDHKKTPPQQHDDCYLCTFSLQPALAPTPFKIVILQPDNFIPTLVKSPSHLEETKVFFSLRAPPIDTDLC